MAEPHGGGAAPAAAAKEERAARVAAAERLCAAESAAGSGHSPISADTVPAQPSRRSSRGKASELWRQCEELRASVAALQQRERELLLQVEQERQRADAAENRSVADPGSPDFSSAAGSQYGAERLRHIVTEREDDLHRARAEFEHISAEAERYKAKAESYKAEAAQYRAEAERAQEAGADTEPPRSVAPSDSQVRGAGSSAAGDREAQEAAHRAELEAVHSQLSELQAKAQRDAQDLAAKAAELVPVGSAAGRVVLALARQLERASAELRAKEAMIAELRRECESAVTAQQLLDHTRWLLYRAQTRADTAEARQGELQALVAGLEGELERERTLQQPDAAQHESQDIRRQLAERDRQLADRDLERQGAVRLQQATAEVTRAQRQAHAAQVELVRLSQEIQNVAARQKEQLRLARAEHLQMRLDLGLDQVAAGISAETQSARPF